MPSSAGPHRYTAFPPPLSPSRTARVQEPRQRRADLHHDQARRRPQRPRGHHNGQVRVARVQAPRRQVYARRRGPAEEALRRPGQEALLPRADPLHGLGPRRAHGLAGPERRQAGQSDARRHQPQGLAAGHHPRRLLRRRRPQHHPRQRQRRLGREGDRPVVRPSRGAVLAQLPGRVGVRGGGG